MSIVSEHLVHNENIVWSAGYAKTPAPTTIRSIINEPIGYRSKEYHTPYEDFGSLYEWLSEGHLRYYTALSSSDIPQRLDWLLHRGTSAPQVANPSLLDTLHTIKSIRNLRNLSAGWNGYNIPEPSETAIEEALSWLETLYKEIRSTQYEWRAPYVSADENGSVVLEWENGENGLAFYISDKDIHYLLDWGYAIDEEMEYGTLTDPSEISALWERLNN